MYKILATFIFLLVIAQPVLAKTGIEKAIDKAIVDLEKEIDAEKINIQKDETITILGITENNERNEEVEDKLHLKLQKLRKFNMMSMERARDIQDIVEFNMTDLVDLEKVVDIAKQYNKKVNEPGFKPISGIITGKVKDKKDYKELYLYLTLLDGTDAWTAGFKIYPKRSTFLAGIYSLIPSGGQLYNGDWLKAGGFITAAAVAALGTVKYHQDYSDAHDNYMKARELDQIEYYREEQKEPRTYRNVLFASYLAIHAIALGEAIFDASGVEVEKSKVESLSLIPKRDSVYLAYSVRF